VQLKAQSLGKYVDFFHHRDTENTERGTEENFLFFCESKKEKLLLCAPLRVLCVSVVKKIYTFFPCTTFIPTRISWKYG